MNKPIHNLRDDNKYKDIEADGLEGVVVNRLSPVPSRSFITTVPKFDAQPAEDRATYWHSLASALNNALDVMQQERNSIIDTCRTQEKHLEHKSTQIVQLGDVNQLQVFQMNAKANDRAKEIHELKQQHRKELQALEAELKLLKG